jgi:putative endonuclease
MDNVAFMAAIILHTTHEIGAAGEETAARYLVACGLQVLARNFRVKGGEIDLICRDGSATVFVEVRRRARSDFGGAAGSITLRKRQRLILAARHWLARHGDCACRFDCVLIEGEQLEWVRDAFSAD